jgi:hypothetical protein
MAAAPWIVSDELWELIEPLLPKKERRFRYPGRRRCDDRLALQGISFVLHTGAASRRVATGGRLGRLHLSLLARLRAAGELEWSRAIADSSQVQAKKGGAETGPSPVGRGRPGCKHHLLVDATGIPLAFSVTAGNRNDVTQLIPLLDAVPPVAGVSGRPRRRPDTLIADRGLRPRQVPPARAGARRQAADRAPSDRTRLRARPLPLGRRAHLRLAAQPQAPPHPLRTPRRHPPRTPRARLLSHLLPPAPELNLK